MCDTKKESGENEPESDSSSDPGEVKLRPGGESQIEHHKEAPTPLEPRKIHPRRPLPPAPEKPEGDER